MMKNDNNNSEAIEQPQSIQKEEILDFVDDVATTLHVKPDIAEDTEWSKISHDQKSHEISNILSRPVRIADITWSSSVALTQVNFPSALFNASANLVDKLNYFTYFRANLHLRIVYNATPFMLGKYWMYFSPYENFTQRIVNGSLMNATGYPGVEIDVASGAPAELVIPYVAPISHFDLIRGQGRYGKIVIQPIQPIASGTASDAVTATLYAWFENVELSMPTNLPVNTTAFQGVTFEGEEEPFEAQVLVAEENGVQATSIVSRLAQYPMSWARDAITSGLNTIGFCKVTDPVSVSKYENLPGAGYTHTNGADSSVNLSATDGNMVQPSMEVFGTREDEMDIKNIAKRFNVFVNPLPWAANISPDAVLATFPVTPGYCREDQDMATRREIYPTQLAFLASMFKYWRGTLRYRITVAKTAFHTGRLRISYKPNAASPVTTNKDFLYSWILDLSKSSEITVDVPFIGNRPWLNNRVGLLGTNNSGTANTDLFCYGSLEISVLTQLRVASTSVAQSVSIVPWIAGHDDIEFAVPDFYSYRPSDISILPVTLDEEEGGEFEAEIFNNTELGTDQTKTLIEQQAIAPLAAPKLTIGETITNLRCLIKRFGPIFDAYKAPYRRTDGSDSKYSSMGPFPAISQNIENASVRTLQLDPAFFGDRADPNPVEQNLNVADASNNSLSQIVLASYPVGIGYQMAAPIHYISTLYRFYRGGRRYKIFFGDAHQVSNSAGALVPLSTEKDTILPVAGNNGNLPTMNFSRARQANPLRIRYGANMLENGGISRPILTTNRTTENEAIFEHTVFPDLNGVAEFELPYYSTLPISVLSNTTYKKDAGPLCQRFAALVSNDFRETDNAEPYFSYTTNEVGPSSISSTINHFNNFRVYTAAADDFSFGFLVGAPKLVRIHDQP